MMWNAAVASTKAARAVRADQVQVARALRTASPPTRPRNRDRAGRDRARIATIARLLRLHITPDTEQLFLTAAMRALGHDARLVLGREYAPQDRPAAYFAWVEVDGQVVSTTEPVREVFQEIATVPDLTSDR